MTDDQAPAIDTHGLRLDFGKYRGERYTRVPIGYLRWMVNAPHASADVAAAELERRGIPLRDRLVDISGHAIDTASLRLLGYWRRLRRSKTEGLHAWLYRFAAEALAEAAPDKNGRIERDGVRLVFEPGELFPTLKTCMPAKPHSKTPREMRHFDTVDEEKRDDQRNENAATD